MHYEDSVYFKAHYKSFSFDERIESILKINDDNLKISIVSNGPKILGYCISSIDDKHGEIDSVYIEEELRGKGYGRRLVNDHIKWMKEKGCKRIRVAVSYGHDIVSEFYHRLSFYERLVYYELKNE